MQLKLPQTQQQKKNYIIREIIFNNLEVFRRPEDEEERERYMNYHLFDSNVYLFIDKMTPCNIVLPFNVCLQHKPIYVGKGFLIQHNIKNSRAVKHHGDLLSSILKADPSRYECIQFNSGMNDYEASSLEAHWIYWLNDQEKFSLSKGNNIGDLLNKRRESNWEKLSEKFLKIDNEWKSPVIYC